MSETEAAAPAPAPEVIAPAEPEKKTGPVSLMIFSSRPSRLIFIRKSFSLHKIEGQDV